MEGKLSEVSEWPHEYTSNTAIIDMLMCENVVAIPHDSTTEHVEFDQKFIA